MSSRQRHVSTCPRTAPVEFPRASAVLHDSPRTQTLNIEGAKRHANVTHLAHDPILTLTCIFAPTNDRDDTRDIDHFVNVLQLQNLYGLLNRLDHGDLPLRHDRDVNHIVRELQLRNFHSFLHCRNPSTCRCTTTGNSTMSKNSACRISPVFCTVCTVGKRRRSTTEEPETPAPAPLKKVPLPTPTALKSSGNDGGYSQLHRTQAPP